MDTEKLMIRMNTNSTTPVAINAPLCRSAAYPISRTMFVVMVRTPFRIPAGILKGVRTMTTNIVLEMGYAADLHRGALIATGVVLFVFILIINFSVSMLNRRKDNE